MASNCMFYVLKSLFTEPYFIVLPQGDGLLPTWQIALAATSLFNTVQNFLTLHFTKRLYNNVPATHPGILLTDVSWR